MEMYYDGALVMPKNYAVVSEEEMTYVDGGGTVKLKIGSNSFVIHALSVLGAGAAKGAMVAALNAIGGAIALSIELGTAGMGTLVAGAFILSWGGLVSSLAGIAAGYGINCLKGRTFTFSQWWVPNCSFTI